MDEPLSHDAIAEALSQRLEEIKLLPVEQRLEAIEEAHAKADRLRTHLRAQLRGKGCAVSADGKRFECY